MQTLNAPASRLLLITSVTDVTDVTAPHGLVVQGIECQAAGDLVLVTRSAENKDSPQTIPIIAPGWRAYDVAKIHPGTTCLPIVVHYGPRR